MKFLIIILFVAVTLAGAKTAIGLDYKSIVLPSSINATGNGYTFNIGSTPVYIDEYDYSSHYVYGSVFGQLLNRVNSTSNESIKIEFEIEPKYPSRVVPRFNIQMQQCAVKCSGLRRVQDPSLTELESWGDSFTRIEGAILSQLLRYNV